MYLTLHSWLGPAAFVCFAGVAFAGCVYCHLQLPETKGRTLAEVQALLGGKGAAGAQSPTLAAASALGNAHEQMIRPSGEASGVVGRGAAAHHRDAGASRKVRAV